MTSYAFSSLGVWILVIAFAAAAHLFGRFALPIPARPGNAASARRARLGVAISISGPLVALLVGALLAALTGTWQESGLVTVALISAATTAGFVLAPR